MIARRTHPAEHGSTISMSILALTIIAMIMLYVGSQTLSGLMTSKNKRDHTVGMAAGDAGIEFYRFALQAGLASEADSYSLSVNDMKALARRAGSDTANGCNGPCVVANDQLPASLKTSPFMAPSEQVAMRMPQGNSIGFWQVYRVIPPMYASKSANDLIVYIRAWATSTKGDADLTTKPRIFRVQYRAGLASDYQVLSDGPFVMEDNQSIVINGPVHSNGFQTSNWLAERNGKQHLGVFFSGNSTPTCGKNARFTVSQGRLDNPNVVRAIQVPDANGCRRAKQAGTVNAKQVPLTGVEQSIEFARTHAAGRATSGATATPYTSIYHVDYLRNDGKPHEVDLSTSAQGYILVDRRLRYQLRPLQTRTEDPIKGDSERVTLLLRGDVRVIGTLRPGQKIRRVTVMNERPHADAPPPRIYLESKNSGYRTVGAANPTRDAVGIVSPGDVVLSRGPSQQACLTEVNVAAISQAGSITFNPELITPSPAPGDLRPYRCKDTLKIMSSFAGHGQFVPSMSWSGSPYKVGYANVRIKPAPNLITNPPPHYPTTSAWAVTEALDANVQCLTKGQRAGDAKCR